MGHFFMIWSVEVRTHAVNIGAGGGDFELPFVGSGGAQS
jgi:hypothetical protein